MSEHIRPSIIAGQWYPGSARELTRMIDQFFAQVEPTELEGEVVALISPHAGYAYSGTDCRLCVSPGPAPIF